MAKRNLYACLASLIILISGCGGGGGGSPVPLPVNKGIVLAASLSNGLSKTSVPIKIIEVSFTLPKTALPDHSNGSLQIGETGLKNLNSNGMIQLGSYDPITGLVQITIWASDPINGDLGTGDIARLTYQTSAGADLVPQDITPVYNVYGPIVNGTSTDLSGEIEPSVRIVTYQKP